MTGPDDVSLQVLYVAQVFHHPVWTYGINEITGASQKNTDPTPKSSKKMKWFGCWTLKPLISIIILDRV